MKKIDVPIVVQPGSQPGEEDGAELDYPDLPKEVWTYAMPVVPEPEEIEGLEPALATLGKLQRELTAYRVGAPVQILELDDLDEANLDLVNQVFGHGEVSIRYEGLTTARIQESVLAGVWRVQYLEAGPDGREQVARDVIEVADIPSLVSAGVFDGAADKVSFRLEDVPPGNSAPLLTEINDKLGKRDAGDAAHVINLSLLPHTEEDLQFLTDKLGDGPVVILSRGYGNCRITATATRNVWWVQYFNSQDTLILNTIEISRVPEVACAAQEDIDDSAERLAEILEVYQ